MRAPSQGEALAVWTIAALDVLAVLVTYSRLDPSELYSVTHEGIAGGLGRALVQLDFPHVAGVAIPIALLALDALTAPARPEPASAGSGRGDTPAGGRFAAASWRPPALLRGGRAWLVGAPAIALCAVFAWPGVVDADDLDPKPVNAIPALGVLLVAGLTVVAARQAGAGFAPRRSGDGARIAAAIAVVLVSLPWLTAELGFHLPGGVFLTDDPYAEPGEGVTAAVHLGHHHGFMGALLVLSALLLSRPRLVHVNLGRAYSLLVSALLAYGAANLVQDLWHEQVVKRGWTEHDIPSVTTPRVAAVWVLVVAGTALAYALGFGRGAERAEPAIIT